MNQRGHIIVFVLVFFLIFVSIGNVSSLSISTHVPEKYTEVVVGERVYFEIDIKWKDGKILSCTIYSNLGGNCRIRSYDPLESINETELKNAEGINPNLFYQVNEIKKPLISSKANIELPEIKETHLYDLITEPGKSYTFNLAE